MVRFAQIVKRIRREELELAIEERRARSDEGLPEALAPPPDWQVMGLPGGAPRTAAALAEEVEVAPPAPARPPTPKATAVLPVSLRAQRDPAAAAKVALGAAAALAAAPAAAAVRDDDFLQSLDALAKPKAAGAAVVPGGLPVRGKMDAPGGAIEDTSVVDSLLDEMVAEEPAPKDEEPAPALSEESGAMAALETPAPALSEDEPESMDDILARMSAGDDDQRPAKPVPQAARPQAAKQAAAAANVSRGSPRASAGSKPPAEASTEAEPTAPAQPDDLGGLEDEWAAALGEETVAPAKDDSLASLEQDLAASTEALPVGSDSQGTAAAVVEAAEEDDPFADLKAEMDSSPAASAGGEPQSTDDLLASLGVGAEEPQAAAADDPFAALEAELGGAPAPAAAAAPAAARAKQTGAGGMDDLSDLLGAASDPDGPGVGVQEAEALKEETMDAPGGASAVDRDLEKAGAAVGSPEDLFAGEPEDIGALLSGGGGTATAEAEPKEDAGDGLDELFASTPEAEPAATEEPLSQDSDPIDEEPVEPPKPKADPNSPEAFASPEDIFG